MLLKTRQDVLPISSIAWQATWRLCDVSDRGCSTHAHGTRQMLAWTKISFRRSYSNIICYGGRLLCVVVLSWQPCAGCAPMNWVIADLPWSDCVANLLVAGVVRIAHMRRWVGGDGGTMGGVSPSGDMPDGRLQFQLILQILLVIECNCERSI